jgi:hypothetical protein
MVLLTCRSSLIRFRPEMSPEFTSVFNGLRGILEKNAAKALRWQGSAGLYRFGSTGWSRNTPSLGRKAEECNHTCCLGPIRQGLCQLSSDGRLPQPKLLEGCSQQLRARMQGKSCFNFKTVDEALFAELMGESSRLYYRTKVRLKLFTRASITRWPIEYNKHCAKCRAGLNPILYYAWIRPFFAFSAVIPLMLFVIVHPVRRSESPETP